MWQDPERLDIDSANLVVESLREDPQAAEIAALMAVSIADLTGQGLVETMERLGSFGGNGILIPAERKRKDSGGGLDPASKLGEKMAQGARGDHMRGRPGDGRDAG